MSDIAIKVENLSKRYRIGLEEEVHDTFAGMLADVVRRPAHNLRRLRRLTRFGENGEGPEPADVIWALKDVSFEVNRGEVVGVIGRNGAGKSTLLKILSRITHPTSGRVELRGRVSSLLEVGTGFHPELTGRENIYLNGTILGMRKAEIDRKFDEIVDFSGVEKFIDTPVKRYSSGMRVRLAFSVAAHLEPEILLVDEVLAVGDISFQKKCLGKMEDVAREGRTILFVSHDMAAIRHLCTHTALLRDGSLVLLGHSDLVVEDYMRSSMNSSGISKQKFPLANPEYGLRLLDVATDIVKEGQTAHLLIRLDLASHSLLKNVGIGIWIYSKSGILITKIGAKVGNLIVDEVEGTCECRLECRNIERYLATGEYSITVIITLSSITKLISAEHIATFRVPDIDVYGFGKFFTSDNGIVPLPIRITGVKTV